MPAWQQRLASLQLLPDPGSMTWEEELVNRQILLPRPDIWGLEQPGGCQELGYIVFNRKQLNLMEENKDGEIATQTLLGHHSNPGGKDIYNKCAGTTGVPLVNKTMGQLRMQVSGRAPAGACN